jgi:hypothetical protein
MAVTGHPGFTRMDRMDRIKKPVVARTSSKPRQAK